MYRQIFRWLVPQTFSNVWLQFSKRSACTRQTSIPMRFTVSDNRAKRSEDASALITNVGTCFRESQAWEELPSSFVYIDSFRVEFTLCASRCLTDDLLSLLFESRPAWGSSSGTRFVVEFAPNDEFRNARFDSDRKCPCVTRTNAEKVQNGNTINSITLQTIENRTRANATHRGNFNLFRTKRMFLMTLCCFN